MTNHTTLDRLAAQCREIAEELEAAHDGDLFEDEDGELHIIRDGSEPDDYDPVDVSEYLFNHAFLEDARLYVDMSRNLMGARVPVCLGGPNVYIDTDEMTVMGYWGADRSCAAIPYEVCKHVEESIEFFSHTAW